MTATRGLCEYLFGLTFDSWVKPPDGTPHPSGRRRRKYGSRQRANAKAGKPLTVRTVAGEDYTIWSTGCDIDLLDMLTTHAGSKIDMVYTQRGTIYAKQFAAQ